MASTFAALEVVPIAMALLEGFTPAFACGEAGSIPIKACVPTAMEPSADALAREPAAKAVEPLAEARAPTAVESSADVLAPKPAANECTPLACAFEPTAVAPTPEAVAYGPIALASDAFDTDVSPIATALVSTAVALTPTAVARSLAAACGPTATELAPTAEA